MKYLLRARYPPQKEGQAGRILAGFVEARERLEKGRQPDRLQVRRIALSAILMWDWNPGAAKPQQRIVLDALYRVRAQ